MRQTEKVEEDDAAVPRMGNNKCVSLSSNDFLCDGRAESLLLK